MNDAQVKLNNKNSRTITPVSKSSLPFKSAAESDYDIKKEEEKKAIHNEIKRVSLIERI